MIDCTGRGTAVAANHSDATPFHEHFANCGKPAATWDITHEYHPRACPEDPFCQASKT